MELKGVRQDVPAVGQGGGGDIGQWTSRVSNLHQGGGGDIGQRRRRGGRTLAIKRGAWSQGRPGLLPSDHPFLPATVRALILPT